MTSVSGLAPCTDRSPGVPPVLFRRRGHEQSGSEKPFAERCRDACSAERTRSGARPPGRLLRSGHVFDRPRSSRLPRSDRCGVPGSRAEPRLRRWPIARYGRMVRRPRCATRLRACCARQWCRGRSGRAAGVRPAHRDQSARMGGAPDRSDGSGRRSACPGTLLATERVPVVRRLAGGVGANRPVRPCGGTCPAGVGHARAGAGRRSLRSLPGLALCAARAAFAPGVPGWWDAVGTGSA